MVLIVQTFHRKKIWGSENYQYRYMHLLKKNLVDYSLISIKPNYFFDMLAMIGHEIFY